MQTDPTYHKKKIASQQAAQTWCWCICCVYIVYVVLVYMLYVYAVYILAMLY